MKLDFSFGGLFGASEFIDVQAARRAALYERFEEQRQAYGRRVVKGQLPDSRHMTMAQRARPHREPRASYEALLAYDLVLAEDGIEQLPELPFGSEAMKKSQLIYQARRAKRHVRSPGLG